MSRTAAVVLAEMAAAIEGIEQATFDKTFAEFETSWLLRHGVQRGIEIISEAARHLPDDLIVTRAHIPWQEVRAIGNMLRHEYHRIADGIIRAVVTHDLPLLARAVRQMQEQLQRH